MKYAKYLTFIMLLLLFNNVNAANSTVVYPFTNAIKNTTIGGIPTKSINNGAGYHVNSINDSIMGLAIEVSGISGAAAVLPSAAGAIGDALLLKAPVNPSLLKKAAFAATSGGFLGLAGYFALEGLQHISQQWYQERQTLHLGPVTGVGTCPKTDADAYCKCNSTREYSIEITAYQNGIPYSGKCNGYNWGPNNGHFNWLSPTQSSEFTPITIPEAETINDNSPHYPTEQEVQALIDAGFSIPINNPAIRIAPSPLNNGSINFVDFQALTTAAQREAEILKSMPTVVEKVLPDGTVIYDYFPSPYTKTDPITGLQTIEAINIQSAPNAGLRLTPIEYPITSTGQLEVPQPGTNPTPQPSNDTDHCELNPDTLGCINLGTPESNTITPTDKTINTDFNQITMTGQCPADKTFEVGGMTHTINMQPICGAATDYIRPLMLLMASITAYFIFVGGLRT